MSTTIPTTTTRHHRAGPLFGAVLLVVVGALALTPVVPPVGAIDPTPAPAHATLTKSVDNTGGGTAAATDWTLSATGPTTISGHTGDSGITNAVVDAGTYTLAESGGPTGYRAGAWNCTGGTLTGSSLVLAEGETASCSITNTFNPPDPTPDPTPTPAPDPTPTPTPMPTPEPTPDPTPEPTPEAVRGYLSMSADAPTEGRRRVDPGAVVTVHLAARVLDDAKDVRVVAAIPDGWSVAGAPGGTVDRGSGTVTWGEGDLKADARVTETFRLRAPVRSLEGRPAFDTVLAARLEHAEIIIDSATVQVRVAPEIIVEHVTLARLDDVSHDAEYLAADVPLGGIDRLDLFRIRFQVRNADLLPTILTPRLEYRVAGSSGFDVVPAYGRVRGVPFYLGTEWRSVDGGRGTLPGPESEQIDRWEIRQHDRDDDTQEPADGQRLMQSAGAAAIWLAGDSYLEVEFTVRASLDLPFDEAFEFRLVDAGRGIPGATIADVRSGSRPPLVLSPGQRDGVRVGPPADARPSAISEMDFPLVTPSVVAAAWPGQDGLPIYRLAVAAPTTPGAQAPFAAPFTSPHMPDVSLVSDTCAICHRAHVSQNVSLLSEAAPQATLCFTCHDGTGSNFNTKAQYTDPTVPANDAATRSYYRHDAVTQPVPPNTHTLATDNEFGGVSNRHSVCADCHNTHNATAALSTQATTGWTVSGRNATTSGVSVANGAAGSPPAYTFLDGTVASQPTREYELCLKCHSGFTTLNANGGQPASRYVLDKAVELNPANDSYHPVEAAGTNATTAMAGSLAGTSPYKQWNFATNGTVRCVNCHGDPRKFNATTPPPAGSDLAPHTSEYRGLLLQNYRDRVLKGRYETYAAADFALCYVCHAEAPFRNSTYAGTNFLDHDKHVSGLANKGSNTSTDIDTAGAGQGNAICSECHFRTHGTALAYKVGDRSNSRLVNFAPNVTGWNGVVQFIPKSATADGSCTLTCHGKAHDNEGY